MRSIVLSLLLGLSVLLGTCYGYGYINEGRSHLCSKSGGYKNKKCGRAAKKPDSVEGSKGFPDTGPNDGYIASANKAFFHKLDKAGAEQWALTPISNYVTGKRGGKLVLNFPWTITSPRPIEAFEYFISKPKFDPTTPLTRDQLKLTPFCVDDIGQGLSPSLRYVSRNCTLDATEYSGQHVILGVWKIKDKPKAIYQVVDVAFSDASSSSSEKNSSSKKKNSPEEASGSEKKSMVESDAATHILRSWPFSATFVFLTFILFNI